MRSLLVRSHGEGELQVETTTLQDTDGVLACNTRYTCSRVRQMDHATTIWIIHTPLFISEPSQPPVHLSITAALNRVRCKRVHALRRGKSLPRGAGQLEYIVRPLHGHFHRSRPPGAIAINEDILAALEHLASSNSDIEAVQEGDEFIAELGPFHPYTDDRNSPTADRLDRNLVLHSAPLHDIHALYKGARANRTFALHPAPDSRPILFVLFSKYLFQLALFNRDHDPVDVCHGEGQEKHRPDLPQDSSLSKIR